MTFFRQTQPGAQPKGRGPLPARQSRRLTSGGTAEADRPRHFGCGFAALRSPCLRGYKSAENHFTTENTKNPVGREIRHYQDCWNSDRSNSNLRAIPVA